MGSQVQALLCAVQFLTRFPVPDLGPPSPDIVRSSVRYYPVVGLLIGCVLAVVAILATALFQNEWVSAALVVVADAWVTGGLHLDGLMDTGDGLLSYRSREEILVIMRDSRVGAMAVIVLVGSLVLRLASLSALSPIALVIAAFITPVFSRSLLLMTMRFTRSARTQGLGQVTAAFVGTRTAVLALCGALIVTTWVAGWPGLVAAVIAALGVSRFCKVVDRRIGAMTGDTYGASVEITQVLMTIGLALRW